MESPNLNAFIKKKYMCLSFPILVCDEDQIILH